MIEHPARSGEKLVRGTHVLVPDVVVAPVTYRPNPFRFDGSRFAVSLYRSRMSHTVGRGAGSRALGDLNDQESEKDPEGEANAQRAPTDDPPPSGTALPYDGGRSVGIAQAQ